jgi:hypothetical protein
LNASQFLPSRDQRAMRETRSREKLNSPESTSTQPTTENTTGRVIGERFRTLSLEFNTTSAGAVVLNHRRKHRDSSKEERTKTSISDAVARRFTPEGFRAVHAERNFLIIDDEREAEEDKEAEDDVDEISMQMKKKKKQGKILKTRVLKGSRLLKKESSRMHSAEHDEILEVLENKRDVVWRSGMTERVKLCVQSDVIEAKWCRFSRSANASLCALHEDGFVTYDPLTGEVLDIPRPEGCYEMWPCKFGMLFVRASDGKVLLVEHPMDAPTELASILVVNNLERNNNNRKTSRHREGDVSGVEIIFSDMDDALIVCRNISSNVVCVYRLESIADKSSIDIEADLDKNLIYRERCVALFEVWQEPTDTQDSIDFINARGQRIEFAESTCFNGSRNLHFCFPEIKLRASIDLVPLMNMKIKHKRSSQNWSLSRTRCSSITSVQSTRAPYLDIIVVGEDDSVELYRNNAAKDVPLCRLAMLHSERIVDDKTGECSDAYRAEIKCNGKVWGSVGNRVNVDVSTSISLRCILPGPPSNIAVKNAMDAMIENDDKILLLRRFYGMYSAGSLQADAEWIVFCNVVKEVCGLQLLGHVDTDEDSDEVMQQDGKENGDGKEKQKEFANDEENWKFMLESDVHHEYLNSLTLLKRLGDKNSVDTVSTSTQKKRNRKEQQGSGTMAEVTSVPTFFSVVNEPIGILESLHVAYECAKLDTTQRVTLAKLGSLIRDLASGLGHQALLAYHSLECGAPVIDDSSSSNDRQFVEQRQPIFDVVKSCELALKGTLKDEHLPSILGRVVCADNNNNMNEGLGTSICDWASSVLRCCYELSPARSFPANVDYFDVSKLQKVFASRHLDASNRFASLAARRNFTLARIARLPSGLQLCFRSALRLSRENPPKGWPSSAYFLIGRDDLAELSIRDAAAKRKNYSVANRKIESSRDGIDVDDDNNDNNGQRNTTAHASLSSTSGSAKNDDDSLDAYDGMDHIEAFVGPLRFPKDRRILELRNLLATAKPAPIYLGNPNDMGTEGLDDDQDAQNRLNASEDDPNSASDPDAVTQQQAKLWARATRTSAAPVGRGAATLRTLRPKPTEPLRMPKLCFSGTLPAQRNAVLRLDLNANPKAKADFTDWPDFHNGVASGLSLKAASDIDRIENNGGGVINEESDDSEITRSWIAFNRPKQASNLHAGALMALGLNGHLSRVTATDLYRYLAQEHEATTVAALLGVSAAKRGTADPATARLCFLHLPARHPLSYPELELPALVQAAALLSVGILHEGTADRMMVEILLAEIGAQPSGERGDFGREGYTLAAGFALGLTTLGLGDNAIGLSDLKIKERLQRYAVGGSVDAKGFAGNYGGANGAALRKTANYYAESSAGSGRRVDDMQLNFDPLAATFEENEYQAEDDILMSHVGTNAGNSSGAAAGNSSNGYVLEGNVVNVDLSAPGAMLALGLMYLKTNDEDAAEHLSVPATRYELDHTQPDFVLLRVVARSLILWDSVKPTRKWVESNCPKLLKSSMKDLDRGYIETSDMDCRSFKVKSNIISSEDDEDEQPRSFREGPDREAEAQALVHSIAGACLSLGLRFAGTADETAASTLRHYCLQFLEWKKAALKAGERKAVVDRPTLEKCVGCCAMAAATVMAGTGDVPTLRLLRHLRARLEAPESSNKDKDKNKSGMSYGAHMAIQTAIGFLFLGGAARTFSTENDAIAYLLIAMYPRFPMDTNDHRCHCQAFRHLYVLASRERLLTTVDIESKTQTSTSVEIDVAIENGNNREPFKTIKMVTPCLAPDTKTIREIRVTSKNLWPTSRSFISDDNNSRKENRIIVNLEIPVMYRLHGDVAVQSNDVSDDVNAASLRPPIIDSVFAIGSSSSSSQLQKLHEDSSSLDIELIRSEGASLNNHRTQHSELFAFDALSNASVLLPPDFKARMLDRSWIDRVNFAKAAQRECTRREIPDALPCYVDLHSTLEHLSSICSSSNEEQENRTEERICETDVRKFSAFVSDVKILEAFLEYRIFSPESSFGDSTKTTKFSSFISRMRNSKYVDDTNDASATTAIPAKLVFAIRRSSELLVEQRTKAFLSRAVLSSSSSSSDGGELMCAYARLLNLPSLNVLKNGTKLALEMFGEISAASLCFALCELGEELPESKVIVNFVKLLSFR